MTPRATYRLQFHKDFGFDKAAAIAPYLARLGVSHVYASPWLKARAGSLHGYDIVDHQALNPELGDEEAFHRMVTAPMTAAPEDLDKLSVLAGVRQFPVRVKCATLAWYALRAAVDAPDVVVSTE